ncbi:MAG: hypothetical protein L3J41_14950 [Melioribacteraceae bacterium]|nr:hypothetical protein [Melioribacteraceae bacterium]
MAQFIAYNESVEVSGEAVLSLINGMQNFKNIGLKILKKFGIENPQLGKWYSQQKWLNAFEEISKKVGNRTLFVIGQKIPETAIFPPDVKSVKQILSLLDTAYHANHRYGDIGAYKFKSISENSGIMTCSNPYPCDFDEGIITSLVKKYNTTDRFVKLMHEPETCRKNGDDICNYLIEW